MSILSVNNLSVSFPGENGSLRAVRDVSFDIGKGETLGLVGESGCGKSVTAYSLLKLVPSPGEISGGTVTLSGTSLLELKDEEIRKYRGKEIAMIFQEPMTSLNPVFTVGYQLSETIMLHLGLDKQEARNRAVEYMDLVGIPNPDVRYNSYPHEFSGGMRQRAMIAMALSVSPSLLIADEPTTALDVTIQAQILDLMVNIQKQKNMAMLFITHDLGIVANAADRVAIMYAGEIVEMGLTENIFSAPLHPYTAGLFNAIPKIGQKMKNLSAIPGTVPMVMEEPRECLFYPRCERRTDECLRGPIDFFEKEDGHSVRCIHSS